jgi:hypothetical protein
MENSGNHTNIKKYLWILIAASVILRAVLASVLELTNDEVNYWLYAMFPAISHYEHPPMVGFFIQFTSLDLLFDSEFFLRLSSVLLGGFNTYLIFLLGAKIRNKLTGLYAAALYTSSLYCFVICGVFIHPDTPMVFFWLLSLYYLIDGLIINPGAKFNKSLLLAGLFIGLGLISKYIIIALWAAAFAYIILYNRSLLKKKEIYISVIISAVCFLPVIIWNMQNQLGTVSFWEDNMAMLRSGIKVDFFFRELLGQFFYNNPVNFIIIITALLALRKKTFLSQNAKGFLLLSGLPLIILLLAMSFFGRTLPHWSGAGYISLILIAAAYLSEKFSQGPVFFPSSVKLALSITALFIITGMAQINYGLINLTSGENKPTELGRNDITLDMYGWRQAGIKFNALNQKLIAEGNISRYAPIFSDKWYNAGHIDYYIARPLNKNVFALGTLGEIRKYMWVNAERGGYNSISEAYYITPSRDYKDPRQEGGKLFSVITPADTIHIERGSIIVENIFVFIMKK